MPRHPSEYGELLRALIARHKTNCWLVNTGWTGGPHGVGRRMPIDVTRRLLAAALDGSLGSAPARPEPWFGLAVPEGVAGVPSQILTPRGTWSDAKAYDAQAARLVAMFAENFSDFEAAVAPEIKAVAETLKSKASASSR
jgi:phosphoenolpyruvate carboxykinase (ATP)